jgi:hypothetical protein
MAENCVEESVSLLTKLLTKAIKDTKAKHASAKRVRMGPPNRGPWRPLGKKDRRTEPMNRPTAPHAPHDRFDVYRFFNGISAEIQEELTQGRTRVPLVKTFLLEHVSSRGGRTPSPPAEILKRVGVEARPLDETFLELRVWEQSEGDTAPKQITAGYLEQYDERFFAFYTADRTDASRKRVSRWISSSPALDSTWFSGDLLQSLWDRDVSHRGDNRFSKLVFRHESIFDMPEDVTQAIDEEEGETAEDMPDEDRPERDRRRVRSEIGDRIGPIRNALTKLQGTYPPLNALYALRFPSLVGRGSHDLYQRGQIKNRAESFEDQRNTGRYLYRTYKSVLERTESSAWEGPEEALSASNARDRLKGVPLIINFTEQLSEATFNRWVSLAFQKRNQFRLWGDPVRLGPTKVHVYGADRHLWQPINLEMTASRVVAILPKGTCGNTFHRLVTSVQRYVCPKIEVWLGAQPFHKLVGNVQASLEEGDA